MSQLTTPKPSLIRKSRSGVALVIILAFVVLLTGVVIAFFSRAMSERQISNSSASQTRVDVLAEGAVDQIIGDLKQEISAASTGSNFITSTGTITLLTPRNPVAMMPALVASSGSGGLENLVKISKSGTGFFPSTINYLGISPKRASAIPTTGTSLNGRSITPARWNKPLFLPAKSGTDLTPDLPNLQLQHSGTFTAPDWILVSRSGTNPVVTSTTLPAGLNWTGTAANTVVGRYAYAIYHEGGLLDVTAAGFPIGSGSSAYISSAAYKPGLAYADLSQIGLTSTQSDRLVLWRNYATLGGALTRASGSNFFNAIISNTTGFLQVSGTEFNGQTDRMFVSRQELLSFAQSPGGLNLTGTAVNALNYLATFTRAIEQPTFVPAVQKNTPTISGTLKAPEVLSPTLGGNPVSYSHDKEINPSIPGVRVSASFTRNDGTIANPGDQLVNKRFALNRLVWITYRGPSASRNTAATSTTGADGDIGRLKQYGITKEWLDQGTAANILKYFGLTWESGNSRWVYDIHRGTLGSDRNIMALGGASNSVQASNREPDFFELLKAGIGVGSLGKAMTVNANTATNQPKGYSAAEIPANVRYNFDSSIDYQIIQIGANILSEVNPTSYPIRIAFDDGSPRGLLEFLGVTDIPYLTYVFNGLLRTRACQPQPTGDFWDSSPIQYPIAVTTPLSNQGEAYLVQIPAVWNPYDPNNATASAARPSQFRILIDSNDPLDLLSPSGVGNQELWFGAVATTGTTPGGGGGSGNQGLLPPAAVYSFDATGLGKTTPKPGSSDHGTVVSDAVTFCDDANGMLYREPTVIFSTTTSGSANRTAGNITGIDSNVLAGDGSTGPWAPLVLGRPIPLAFSYVAASGTLTCFAGSGALGLAAGIGDNRVYFTYRMQYQDPNGNWVTYDTKYGRTTHGLFSFESRYGGFKVINGPDWYNPYSWAAPMDPRTARFGLFMDTFNGGRSRAPGGGFGGWIYNSNGIATTPGITAAIRADNSSGFYFVNLDPGNLPVGGQTGANNFGLLAIPSTRDIPYPTYAAGWTTGAVTLSPHGSSDVFMFAPGMYAQNSPSAPFYAFVGSNPPAQPSYYADPDGVIRRGASAYVPPGIKVSGTTSVGIPPASINGYDGKPPFLMTPASNSPFTQSQSRPLLLHRPFRTVAELGYVFRDVPWKNLDFFTPESADAGLLDLFCINETSDPNSLVAGKVNLNTRQAPVIKAIVSGACVDDPKITDATVGSVSPFLSGSVALALTTRTADLSNGSYGPLTNISELVGKWVARAAISTLSYSPSNSSALWGVDLDSTKGYMDGQRSYSGFSGNAIGITTSGKDLNSAFAPVSAGSITESMAFVKRFREAPIRALASVGQTRVWNLMIDVVAQTGRYPKSVTDPSKFIVEGEQRYWVHLAIDRLTGKIIDKQVEVVKE